MFPDMIINGKDVTIKSEFNFGVSKDISDIFCLTKISYLQEEKLLLIVEVICFFSINEEGSKQIVEQSRIDVGFLRYLATIATGTVRGIIHTKTENTALSPIVLPPINLVEAIKDDFVLAKTKE